jgi:hypothetical protein
MGSQRFLFEKFVFPGAGSLDHGIHQPATVINAGS